MSRPGQTPGRPATGQDEITLARRRLGRRLRAWRLSAGLSQQELGLRCGHFSRSAVHNAERGTSGSRSLFEAADTATKAEGALLADYDQTAALISAIRQQAARQARAALAQATRSPPGMNTAGPDAVAVLILRCPRCGTSLPATVSIHLAPTTPAVDAGPRRD